MFCDVIPTLAESRDSMPRTLPVMHHVVFAVAPERRDAAVQFLESLGFRFHRHELTDVGLQVMLDWDGGVEIVTPTAPDDRNPGSVAEFLAREGDGVYSVVMRVAMETASSFSRCNSAPSSACR
jgi:4-hydroxyphenylpyruvate dioxygenase-like putative hemolysin